MFCCSVIGYDDVCCLPGLVVLYLGPPFQLPSLPSVLSAFVTNIAVSLAQLFGQIHFLRQKNNGSSSDFVIPVVHISSLSRSQSELFILKTLG